MQVVIDIPDEKYNVINSVLYNTFPAEMKEWGLDAIRKGISLSKEKTNGDVIMTLFPNAKIERGIYGLDAVPLVCLDLYTEYDSPEMSFKESWWNASYKSESEVLWT